MRRAAARYSCSGRLADDRPMSRLSDSSLILTSQFRVRSIILMLLLIQMSNMSNLSLCQNGLVAVGVQEQAEDILVPPLLRNCLTLMTFPFLVIISPPEQLSLQ